MRVQANRHSLPVTLATVMYSTMLSRALRWPTPISAKKIPRRSSRPCAPEYWKQSWSANDSFAWIVINGRGGIPFIARTEDPERSGVLLTQTGSDAAGEMHHGYGNLSRKSQGEWDAP